MPTEGTCPVCERAIRVRAGRMVHHGFQRPGRGHIVGDCYGVGREPYEVSCAGTRAYKEEILQPWRVRAEGFLARLEAGAVELLHQETHVPVPTTLPLLARGSAGWTTWWMPVRRDESEPERQRLWKSLHAASLRETQAELRQLAGEIDRCERLIRDWQPAALRDLAAAPPPTEGRCRRRRLFSRYA